MNDFGVILWLVAVAYLVGSFVVWPLVKWLRKGKI